LYAPVPLCSLTALINTVGSALRNWTNGNWANGTRNSAGSSSPYGANFQAITWAQQNSGYLDAAGTPNATFKTALHTADARLGTFLKDLKAAGTLDSTLLLLGSKQGQGPINPKNLEVSDPQTVINGAGVPVAFFVGEDGGIVSSLPSQRILCPSSAVYETNFIFLRPTDVASERLRHPNRQAEPPRQFQPRYSIRYRRRRSFATNGYGSPYLDPRVPDLVIETKPNVLWNVGFEIMDHGGFLPQDLNVPLLAYNPILWPLNITLVVSNRQVASTLLHALGLPLAQVNGYRFGEAPVLPYLFVARN